MGTELLLDEKAVLEAIKNPWTIGIDYEEIPIPEGVKVSVEGKKVIVEGPKGKVEKDFSHVRGVYIINTKVK